MKFVVLTGMSGAGKSTALKVMEDIGYFCVDNLPIVLMEKFAELANVPGAELQKVAIGVDIRSGRALNELQDVLDRFRQTGIPFDILYLDSRDGVLVKRYKETRRSHPLAAGERVDRGHCQLLLAAALDPVFRLDKVAWIIPHVSSNRSV